LFSSFEQADSSTSRKFGGTGLGLAISKRIIELMNGKIWIEMNPGGGSIFIFTIALKAGTELVQEDLPESPVVDGSFSSYTMLLAEDVEINREILVSLLEPTGIKIDCAVNGVEALAMYKADPDKYGLVFMDVQMPEMDGYEATRQIRAFETRRAVDKRIARQLLEVPIIAMTANVFREDVEKCRAAGMNGHVGKPLDMHEVLGTLGKYLKKR
jgi:CheY-like chemotaxis protein